MFVEYMNDSKLMQFKKQHKEVIRRWKKNEKENYIDYIQMEIETRKKSNITMYWVLLSQDLFMEQRVLSALVC